MAMKDETEKSFDHVTEQEHEYAKTALAEFTKKNYMGCLQYISKLEKRTEDYKVIHNKHVVEFCKSDTKKLELFQKNINTVFKQFNLKVDKLDDVDHCVMYFNQAVLLFHQKQYTQSLNIMERVYKFIEPLDDTIGRQIGFLLMELYICGRQMDKGFALLSYLKNNINQVPQLPVKILSKNSTKETKKVVPGNADAELFVKKLDVYEIRCNLLSHCLPKSREKCLQVYKDDAKNVNGIFLLANQEYLEGNFSNADKLLQSIPIGAIKYSDTGESSSLMVNNNLGVLYHAQGKPNLACYYFQQALKEDVNISQNSKNANEKPLHLVNGSKYHELIYNIGISLLHAGKAAQAFDYLIIAVRRYHRNSSLWLRLAECCISVHRSSNQSQFDISRKQDEMVASVIGEGEQQRFILNTSVAGETKYSSNNTSYAVPVPTLEFASLCLRNALLLLPKPPILTPTPPTTTNIPKTTTTTTGTKTSTTSATIGGVSSKNDSLSQQDSQKPLQSFPNTALLMPTGCVMWTTGAAAAATLPPPPGCAPSAPLSANGVCSLRNAILAASSYVALQLGNYVLALEHAEVLLGHVPQISGAHKLLGHLYAAEALVLMDKISEAIDHLNPTNIQDISLELPKRMYKKKEQQDEVPKTTPPTKWIPSNMASTLTVLKYNIAVAKTIRGQLDQASEMLKEIWDGRNSESMVPAHILMLFIYIELQLGHIDAARALVKQYTSNKYRN